MDFKERELEDWGIELSLSVWNDYYMSAILYPIEEWYSFQVQIEDTVVSEWELKWSLNKCKSYMSGYLWWIERGIRLWEDLFDNDNKNG